MAVVRILGIGSPFGDDILGWQAVEQLQRDGLPAVGGVIEWQRLDRPGAVLLESLRGADTVVIIDALHSGSAAGTVQRLLPEQLLVQARVPSSHDLGVAETLLLARALDELPPRLLVYGIELQGALKSAWYPALRGMLLEDLQGLSA